MRRRLVQGTALAAAGVATAGAVALYRSGARRWQADDEELQVAGLALPAGVRHHLIEASDGGRLHVVEHGSGPPIVLVHGITLSSSIWALQLDRLADRHRVVAVDMRGHGRSEAGRDGYGIDRLADDLLDVLQALEIEQAVLAGHSMGGMVSLRLACQRPDEMRSAVASLALVGTGAGPVVMGPQRERTASLVASQTRRGMAKAQERGRGVLPPGDLGSWLSRASFGTRPLAPDVAFTRSVIETMPIEALPDLMATLLAFDVRRDIGRIALPTRVLVGTRDILTPPRMARALKASIPGSTLVTFPGAGHMLMLERAEELDDILHDMSLGRRSAEVA